MTDIILRPKDPAVVGAEAFDNYTGILEAKAIVGKGFLHMGRLLKENRDKKFYAPLGYDTFEDFIGSPEVAMSRSMVFDLIRAVEVFIDKLGRPPDELAQVGISKLSAIVPVVEKDPEEWLSKAKELSRSDLQDEVHEVTGTPVVRRSDTPRSTDWRAISPGQTYLDYVRDVPCCICGTHATEGAKTHAAHFPLSRGAGAPADWVIPMCGTCHAEHHKDPVKFLTTYQRQWAAWFFRTLKMFDDTLKTTEATLATYTARLDATGATKPPATKHDEALPSPKSESDQSDKKGGPGSRALGTNRRALGTNPRALGTNPRSSKERSGSLLGSLTSLHSKESSDITPETKSKNKSLPSPTATSVPGNAPGALEDSSLLTAGPSVVTTKQIWPPDVVIHDDFKVHPVDFRKCPGCGLTTHPDDFNDGLCIACNPRPLGWTSMEVADGAAMPPIGLAFPKPAKAKRRAKKGGSK